jgi:hypothetical protein
LSRKTIIATAIAAPSIRFALCFDRIVFACFDPCGEE